MIDPQVKLRLLFSHLALVESEEIYERWPPPTEAELDRADELRCESERSFNDALALGATEEDCERVLDEWVNCNAATC